MSALRSSSQLLVVLGVLSLASACTAILGIDHLPDEDGSSTADATTPADAEAADSTAPGDAEAAAADDGGDGGTTTDGPSTDAVFPYRGALSPTQLASGYSPIGIGVSPRGDCVAVAANSKIALYSVDAGALVAAGALSFGAAGDMVFDPASKLFFAQSSGTAGNLIFTPFLLNAECGNTGSTDFGFAVPGDASTVGSSLAVITTSPGYLLVGASSVGATEHPAVLAFDMEMRSLHGELFFPAASMAPTSIATNLSGSVIAAVVDGHVYISDLDALGSSDASPGTPTLSSVVRVAVDNTGRSVFALTGSLTDLKLVQLQPGDAGWAVATTLPLSTDGAQEPRLVATDHFLLVSTGDGEHPALYAYALDGNGALVTPPTERQLPVIAGLSVSTYGEVLGVAGPDVSASGIYFADASP